LSSIVLFDFSKMSPHNICKKKNRARIFKRIWSPGFDSKEWIPSAYVARRAGMITLFLLGS
jgi:hypothetical protein